MAQTETVHQIPLSQVIFSPLNPRRSISHAAIEEMAVSIRANGVMQPIVVRPSDLETWQRTSTLRGEHYSPEFANADRFEIVFGERRTRAALLVDPTGKVPAIIRAYTDLEAANAMVVENDQREDLNPIEQARGYATLKRMREDRGEKQGVVEAIAKTVGKSAAWIYGRLKLLDLTGLPLRALELGRITPGHGILIARLDPMEQSITLRACFDCPYTPGAATDAWLEDAEKWPLVLSEKTLRDCIGERYGKDASKQRANKITPRTDDTRGNVVPARAQTPTPGRDLDTAEESGQRVPSPGANPDPQTSPSAVKQVSQRGHGATAQPKSTAGLNGAGHSAPPRDEPRNRRHNPRLSDLHRSVSGAIVRNGIRKPQPGPLPNTAQVISEGEASVRLYDVATVALVLRLSVRRVEEIIQAGALPAERIGPALFVTSTSLKNYHNWRKQLASEAGA